MENVMGMTMKESLEGGGINWEIRIDLYTLLSIK